MGEKGWWLCGCLPNKKKEKEKKDKKKKDKKDKDGKSSSSKSKGKNKEDDLGTNAFSNMVNQTINCKACQGYGWWHRHHLPHEGEDDKRCKHCTPCKACGGSGAIKNTFRDCHLCKGNGHIHRKQKPHEPVWRDWCPYCSKCPYCEGMGAEDGEAAPLCFGCDGKGHVHHNPDERHEPLRNLDDGWCYHCETCTGCEGLGYAPLESQQCFVCDGHGFVHFARRPHHNKPDIPCRGCSLCPGCDGRGCLSDKDEACHKCKGKATVHLPENIEHDPIFGNFCIYCTLCKTCQNTGVALNDGDDEEEGKDWFSNMFSGGDKSVECPRCFGYGFHHCVVEPHCMLTDNDMARPIPDEERCDDCDDCEVCMGTGRVEQDLPLCWMCKGMGFRHRCNLEHNPVWRDVCVHCQYCYGCDGRGVLSQEEFDTFEMCENCNATGFEPEPGAMLIAHDYYHPSTFCHVCQGKGMHKVGLGNALASGTVTAPKPNQQRARRSSQTHDQLLVGINQMQGLMPAGAENESDQDNWNVMTNPDAPIHDFPGANADGSNSDDSDDSIRDKIADDPTPRGANGNAGAALAGSAAAIAASQQLKQQGQPQPGMSVEDQRREWNANKDVMVMRQQEEQQRLQQEEQQRLAEEQHRQQLEQQQHEQQLREQHEQQLREQHEQQLREQQQQQREAEEAALREQEESMRLAQQQQEQELLAQQQHEAALIAQEKEQAMMLAQQQQHADAAAMAAAAGAAGAVAAGYPQGGDPAGSDMPTEITIDDIQARQADPEGFARQCGYEVGSMVALADFQADLPDMDWDAEILCPGELGEVVSDEASKAWCIVDDDGLLWVNIRGPPDRNGAPRPADAQMADFYCADDLVLQVPIENSSLFGNMFASPEGQ